MAVDPYLTSITKTNSTLNKGLKTWNHKTPKKNKRKKVLDIGLGDDILEITLKG